MALDINTFLPERINIDISSTCGFTTQVDVEINLELYSLSISGTLRSYNTGRSIDFEFEPDWFCCPEAEEYYDQWSAELDTLILDKHSNTVKN